MVWFKVDDGFYSSQKVLSIPRSTRLAAVGLWTMAGNWSARELTDGKVPEYVLAELGATPRLRQALVEARLWLDRGSAGVEFNNWADYQPTRDDVESERAASAERQRKWRERKRAETRESRVTNTVSNGGSNGVSNAAPTRPDPTIKEKRASKDAATTQTLDHRVTDSAYQAVGKAFNFIAVRGIVKWALTERNESPAKVNAALIAIHEMGKPITKQTVGQYLDGTLGSPIERRRAQATDAATRRWQAAERASAK